MPVPSSNPNDTLAAIAVLVVIFAGICVIYWRIVVQVLIVALISLALFSVVMSIMGAIYLTHHLHHL
ncbi:MAG TPA: hypothetical protein VMI73_29665 [Trebonia sp.]|nr:hypothetical protein [Trebonia sp.]